MVAHKKTDKELPELIPTIFLVLQAMVHLEKWKKYKKPVNEEDR